MSSGPRTRWRRAGAPVAVAAAVGLVGAGVAYAGVAREGTAGGRADSGQQLHASHHGGADHHGTQQDGAGVNHLPAVNRNVELVSKLRLTGDLGRVSDVFEHEGYAYLGAYDEPTCETGGVYVVDVRDLSRPRQIGFIKSHEDTYTAEGVNVVSITTPQFSGDVLAFSNETCTSGKTNNGVGGFTLVDVSNPRSPKKLVEGFGDFTVKGKSQRKANMTHSVLLWDAGDRAYAVAVDDIDDTDVDIFDITNPSKPVLIRETGFPDWPDLRVDGFGDQAFLHDVEVRQFGDRWVMVASYWDGGYVLLDVTDPAQPVFLRDSDFEADDPEFPGVGRSEGNAHQAAWTRDGEYLVATDEDFSPYRTNPLQITTGLNAGTYTSVPISGGGPVTLLEDKRLNGPTVYGGYGCDSSAPIPPRSQALPGQLPAGEEAILVLQRGPTGDPSATEPACFPGDKARNGLAAGYDAVVIAARHLGSAAADASPFCGSGGYPTTPVVSFCISHTALHALFGKMPAQYGAYVPSAEPAVGDLGEKIDVTALFDGWGYVRLLDPGSMDVLDTFAVAETKLEENAIGRGDLSVHEVDPDLHDPRLMHSSYYAAGYRALRVVPDAAGGARLQEVGAFIDEGGNNFWGVHPTRDSRPGKSGTAVLLSDRDFGLYVVKHTQG